MGTLRKILKFLGVFVILACANFGVAHAEFSTYVTINDNGATTASQYSGLYYNADDTACDIDRYYDGLSCKYTKVIEFTAPTKTGFKYLGHYTLQTGGRQWSEPIANGKARILQGYGPGGNNPTVYAHWRPIKITLNHQNATTNGAPDILYLKAGTGGGWYRDEAMNQPITALDTVPHRTGYTFLGYFTTQHTGGVHVTSISGDLYTSQQVLNAFTDDATIYARWIQNHTVTLNPNGGTPTGNQYIYTRGGNFYADSEGTNRITSSIFNSIANGGANTTPVTRSGYTFNGYYDAASGGTQMINSAGVIQTSSSFNNSQTWYAQYQASCDSTIVLEMDGGTLLTDCETEFQPTLNGTNWVFPDIIPSSCIPTRDGYKFNGYVYNTTTIYNGELTKMVTNYTYCRQDKLVLTAQWRANEYTATFTCEPSDDIQNDLSSQGYDINAGNYYTGVPNPVTITGLVYGASFTSPELTNVCKLILNSEHNDDMWFSRPSNPAKWVPLGYTVNCSGGEACTYPANRDITYVPNYVPRSVSIGYRCDTTQLSPYNCGTVTLETRQNVTLLAPEDLCYNRQCTMPEHATRFSGWKAYGTNQPNVNFNDGVVLGNIYQPGTPLSEQGVAFYQPAVINFLAQWECDTNYVWNEATQTCEQNTFSVKYMCYVGDPTGQTDQATATNYTVRAMDWYGQCDINSNTPVPDYKWRFSYNGSDYNAGETIPSWTYGNDQTFTPAYTATFKCVNTYWQAPTGVSESTAQSVLLGGTLTMPIMPCEVRPEYDGWLETDYAWETRYTQTLISPVPYANCNASSSDLHYRPGDSFPWNCPTDLTFEPLTKFIEKPITVSCGGGSESATYTMTFNNQDEIKQEIIYFFGHSCGGHCLLSNPTGSPTGYNNKIVCATDWGNQPIPDSWVSIENDAQGRICYKTPADTDVQLILAEISLAQITDLDISNITHCPQPVTYKCSEDATDEYNGAPYAVFEREYRIQTPGTVGCESGFAFNNWKNLDDDRIFVAGNTVDVWPYEDEVTLIAQWGEPNTYNITYNCGNDTGTTQTDNATYGENYTVKNNAGYTNCEKPGYSFLGWVFSVNGRTYNEGEVFQPWNYANDATFTAKWSDTGNTYTITYKPNYDGATESNETQNVTYGATFTTKPAGTFYRPGYEMSGWSAPFPQMDQEYAYNIIGDTSLNAQWQMCVEGTYSGATQCTSCPEDYPFSVDGASAIEQCYRNCSFTCTTVACPANSTCTQTDTMYDGTEYYGGTCNADPLNCEILTVTCNANYYFDGTVCQPCPTGMTSPQGSTSSEQCVPVLCDDGQYLNNITCENCPNGYPHSDPNATSQSQCYHDCETPCTEPACPANSTSCTYGTNPNSGAWYFGTDACNATPWVCPIETATCAGGYGWNPTNHTCEPCTGNEASINNSCEPCQDGTQPNADHTACVPCPNWTAGTNGTCEPCAPGYVPNAQATACVPCPAGQHIEHSECKDDVMECGAPHAAYATRTWNPRLGAYGSCQIQECEDGYHVASNACVPNDQLCNVANGRGKRIWNGTQWGNCVVSECDPGFEPNASDTACGRCGNYMGADGQPKVSSYIAECEIATCMYQGQKYALENGECRPICNKQDDRTGHMEWNESTKKCVRTCNPGYKMW